MTLPEFLILGAPKCGTTALAAALGQHPQLFVPERKEPSFFDENWERGQDWFAAYFAGAGAEQLRGEATPEYFATPVAAERIARTNPGCKLVAVVRDPVQRAHSHYWFRWNSGRERRSVEQVLAEETDSEDAWSHGYLLRHGMYGRNLEQYRRLFGADRILILGFDELIRESELVLARCQKFLGVPVRTLTLEHANAARTPAAVFASRALQGLARYQGWPKRLLRQLIDETMRRRLRRALLRTISRAKPNPPLAEGIAARLRDIFGEDSEAFERAVGKGPLWRTARNPEHASS